LSERSSAIARRWRALGKSRALIPYLTAGFPDYGASLDAVRRVVDAGADFVEVGVPFSDPIADGPTIQRTTHVALGQGMTLGRTLELVHAAALEVPVVIMTYLNPVLSYGVEKFVDDAAAAGVAGVLLTDLPAGDDERIESSIVRQLDIIRLVAPTTDAERLSDRLTAFRPHVGFVYLISRLGVTGARAAAPADLAMHVQRIRAVFPQPIVVGFGIGTPQQAAAASRVSDGVVVGSALMDALAQNGPAGMEKLTRELAAAVHG